MKSCARYRLLLANSFSEALEPNLAEQLKEHLERCPDCRRYQEELQRVVHSLKTVVPFQNVPMTKGFHQRLKASIQAEQESSYDGGAWTLPWRMVLLASAVVLALMLLVFQSGNVSKPAIMASLTSVVDVPHFSKALPTLGAYQQAARQSNEAVDILLRSQTTITSCPESKLTASQLARIELEVN